MTKPNKILVCGCVKYGRIPEINLNGFISALEKAGIGFELIPDLCRVAAEDPETLCNSGADMVAACFPRAVKSLFDFAGADAPECIDLRNGEISTALDELGLEPAGSDPEAKMPEMSGEWTPWFPVIDRDRCVKCGKCVDFCLFGVYRKNPENGEIEVCAPANCKTNCPACARMCPVTAIIFPKHEDSPINGGIDDSSTPVKVDPQAAFDRNLYDKLAARRRNKRSVDLFKDEEK